MLKDLDQRQAEQQGSSDFNAPVSSASSNKKTVFISLIVIILLNIVGIFVWQMYVENQTLKMSISPESNTPQNNTTVKKLEQTIAPKNSSPEQILESRDLRNNANDINQDSISNTLNQDDFNQNKPDVSEMIKGTQENTTSNNILGDNDIRENVVETTVTSTNDITNNANNQQELVKPIAIDVKRSTLQISRKKLTPGELAKQKLLRAEQALANNNIAQAETLFEDVLLVIPDHKSARKQLAALWFGREAYSDALNLLSQGINLSPNDSEFRVMKARVYLQQNQVKQAFLTLNAMPRVNDVTSVEYQSLRATTAQQLNEFSFAAEAYQVLVSIEPSASRWWLGLAVAHDSNSEFEQASNAYQTALNRSGLSGSAETFARQRIIELGE
jgi:MSHA biogenesis protein MshN